MDNKEEIAKFVPVQLVLDEEISTEDKNVLEDIVKVCRRIDELFLEQVYAKNRELIANGFASDDEAALFHIHFGPFNRLEDHEPFIDGHQKPKGANYYPHDMTKDEFSSHIALHPEQKLSFLSPYTIIGRDGNRQLISIPYSNAFRLALADIHADLFTASQKTSNASLKKFLQLRAKSFISDDYLESEMAWMDLDSDLDIAIGPYEVYEDELLGIKTGYEAIICKRLHAETKKLEKFKQNWNLLDRHLPVQGHSARGSDTPLVVADMIYNAGEARAGVQAIAFNLPNDERVRQEKGSKQVLMKNMCHAKYDGILMPIVEQTMHKDMQQYITFDGFFTHVLLHEISHGLGPGTIEKNGNSLTLQEALQETYSTIEEAKAEVLGVHNAYVLADNGIIEKELAQQMGVGLVANTFRAIRFGITESHGAADIIIFNKLRELGVVSWIDGKVSVNVENVRDGYTQIATELLEIEAQGDYQRAQELIKTYRVTDDQTDAALARLNHIPVDIKPIFPKF